MLMRLEYLPLRAEKVCLQLEGLIADSTTCPRMKDNKVWYEEYATENIPTTVGQDIIVF
jgi:hypothetical protein